MASVRARVERRSPLATLPRQRSRSLIVDIENVENFAEGGVVLRMIVFELDNEMKGIRESNVLSIEFL